MLFKGTSNRTRQQIEWEVESIGAQMEAFTTREMTVLYIKVRKDGIPQAIDILGDVICNSTFAHDAVEEERWTILHEMDTVAQNVRGTILDELHGMAFRDQPIGLPILGSVEEVSNISTSQVRRYARRHFTSENMCLVAVGSVDHLNIAALAEKSFRNVSRTKDIGRIEPPIAKGTANFEGAMVTVERDDVPHSHVAFAYETAGWTDPDNVVLQCYRFMLDSYVKGNCNAKYSSNESIADIAVHDLAKSIAPFSLNYSDTGLLGIYSVHESGSTEEGIRVICENFLRHTHNCHVEDLEEAKRKLQLASFSFNDGTTALCEDIGKQMLMYGRRIHPLETLLRIEEVDMAALNRVGRRFFCDTEPVVAAVGLVSEVQPYEWWQRKPYPLKK